MLPLDEIEEFDQSSIEGLIGAGWNYSKEDFKTGNSISIYGGELSLTNDGSYGWGIVRKQWNIAEVYYWKYTAMAKLVGQYSALILGVAIHNYSDTRPYEYVFHFGCQGFSFNRNYPYGEILLNGTHGLLTQNEWFTLALERKDSSFTMYVNDSPKWSKSILLNSTLELGELVQFGMAAGTGSAVKFEWLKIEYALGMPQDSLSYLLIDGIVLGFCSILAVVAFFAYGGSNMSRTYLVLVFLISLTSLIVSIFLMRKLDLSESDIAIVFTLSVGLATGAFLEAYFKKPRVQVTPTQQIATAT